MEQIKALAAQRKSVRSYDGAPLRAQDREKLAAYLAQLSSPFDLPMEFRILDAKAHGLSSPVVTGVQVYAAGKIARAPMAEVAYGYAFEEFILYAASLGVGTVWIAGTMDRPAFERAMETAEDELMPAVTPLGYPAKKRSLRDAAMRRAMHADARQSFEALFFEGGFDTPLPPARAGIYVDALEAVRLAPSAVNKQPWRIVKQGDEFHFYKKSSLPATPKGDVQKLDIGIALAHFDLTLAEQGVTGLIAQADPGIPHAADTEYIVSWQKSKEA